MPLRNITDQEGTLEDYCFALSDFSSEAVWNSVNNLRAGKIDEASKDFCPKAPKLAEYVRAEQRRLDAVNRPPAISYSIVKVPFKDWRIIHRQKADALEEQDWVLYPEKLSLEEMKIAARRGRLRIGATWFWSLQEAWMPPIGWETQN